MGREGGSPLLRGEPPCAPAGGDWFIQKVASHPVPVKVCRCFYLRGAVISSPPALADLATPKGARRVGRSGRVGSGREAVVFHREVGRAIKRRELLSRLARGAAI